MLPQEQDVHKRITSQVNDSNIILYWFLLQRCIGAKMNIVYKGVNNYEFRQQ